MASQNVIGTSYGYDTWIEFPVQFCTWELPRRFIDMKVIGSGAFGSVCSSVDIETKRNVAIKRCTTIFLTQEKALSVYRELSLLYRLKNDRIVKLYDVMIPPSSSADISDTLLNLYLVMEFCGNNLDVVLKSQNFEASQICSLLGQILEGLAYIHSAGIVHRDIKTHNILLNDTGEITIIDFGLACKVGEVSLGYVSTWWNTAPEILLSLEADERVDIWSVGCVLAELLTGSPLFTTTNKCHLLKRMVELLNITCWEWVDNITDERLCETARSVKDLGPSEGLANILHTYNGDLICCLEMLLQFDSRQRPSAEEALKYSLFNLQTHSHAKYAYELCPMLDCGVINESQNPIEYLRELIMECIVRIQSV